MKKQKYILCLFLIVGGLSRAGTAHAALPGAVAVWEHDGGQTTVPVAAQSEVTAIAAGSGLTMALKSDGTIVAWGWGSVQTNLPPGLSNVTAIAAGDGNPLALKSDGTVVAWGYFAWGSDQTTTPPAGLSGVRAIAGGFSHSVALKSNGTVVAWGHNNFGQTNVPAGLSNITAIAAGLHMTVALKSDGTVVAWGWGDVPNGLSNVTAIASSSGHTLALKRDGTVVAWGYNDYGQTDVPPGLSNVTAIAAGGACPFDCEGNSAALRSDGTVVAWGSLTKVPVGLGNVTAIALGAGHTAALLDGAPPAPSLKAKASGHELILFWPTNAVGFTLQFTLDLTPPVTWTDSPSAPLVARGQFNVTNAISGTARFHRLKKP